MTRHRYHHTLTGDDLLLYGRYPGLRALHPAHDRAPARRPAPDTPRLPHKGRV
jgi:hypothetical protein